MAESVWLKQVEEGLMAEIRTCVTYTDENGKKVPVNRVFVKKPEDEFLGLTGEDEDIDLPCVTISNYMDTFDKKRANSLTDSPIVVSMVSSKMAEVEERAKPYKLFYQMDFWAEYEDDVDKMTLTWLARHSRWFNLPVVDNGGTKRTCYAAQQGSILRSDQTVKEKRLFRAIINYCIRVEIDENIRYNKPAVESIGLSSSIDERR